MAEDPNDPVGRQIARWQIDLSDVEAFDRFQNAAVNAVDSKLDRSNSNDYGMDLERRFAILHGSSYGPMSNIRTVLYAKKNRRDLAVALEHLLWAVAEMPQPYGTWGSPIELLAAEIDRSLRHHPFIGLRLVKEGDIYELHPAGAQELDRNVDTVLLWLKSYPGVRIEAVKGLRALAEGDLQESLNSVRVALEMLVRALLGNSKTLENQITGDSDGAPLLAWVRSRGAKAEVVNLLQKNLKAFSDVQNAWVKHPPSSGSSFDEAEAEYGVYSSFAVMRFLLQVARTAA